MSSFNDKQNETQSTPQVTSCVVYEYSAEDKKRKTEKIAQSIFFIYVFSEFFILKLNSIF